MAGRLRVLVAGVSIAGPATAYWLARGGAELTVIERFAGIRKGGNTDVHRSSPSNRILIFCCLQEGKPWTFVQNTCHGLQCGVRDHVHLTNTWAAYFSTKKDYLGGSKIGLEYSAPRGRFTTAGSKSSGGGHAMMMSRDTAAVFRRAAEQGKEREFVAQHYMVAGWISNELVEELKTAKDFYASEIVQVKVLRLHKGRFVLVRDAGYAVGPTGFGTSIALAGVYILAGEIKKHTGDVEAALEAYEGQMRPLIREMQKIPPFLGCIVAPQSAWVIWVRNCIFAFVAWSGVAEFLQRFFAGALEDSKEFPLSEYEWNE